MSGIDNPIPISDEEVLQRKRNKNNADSRAGGGGDGSSSSQHRDATGADILPNEDSATKKDGTDYFNLTGVNVNSYASKKTFAQGLLDLALLTANAAQLKYVLSAGDGHPFYTLLLALIITSICLQVAQAVICIILGLILDINKIDEVRKADIINNISVAIIVVIVTLNVVISAFDIKYST